MKYSVFERLSFMASGQLGSVLGFQLVDQDLVSLSITRLGPQIP